MIVDTSALVSILAQEPDSELYIRAISHASHCRISAGNFLELSIVLEGQFGSEVLRQCDALFRRIGIVIEPVTVEQVQVARQAFHDFGRGRHAAGLDFGDCFGYALAKLSNEPLVFKADDFKKTDVVAAL
jgi:ribonuclease VapC